MVTNFEKLVSLCDEELRNREYESKYYFRIVEQWNSLREWLEVKGIKEFSETIGNQYCDEVFGTHLMPKRSPASFREKLRAIRMLISYQKNGDFEFRCPSIEYTFSGIEGDAALMYLDYCKDELLLSVRTIENKRLYLYNFCKYLQAKGIGFDDLTIEITEDFFKSMDYTLASRHNAARNISLFLRFVYDAGKSLKDSSVFILPDNYKKDCKLPTTYEEDEINELVRSVERSSAIGKRDYLILLLVLH